MAINKINKPDLIPNKLPLENIEPSGEESRYYLSSREYNELLEAVLELIDDYNEKLASGWEGGGGGETIPIIKSTDDTGASDTTVYSSLMTLAKLIELKEDIQDIIDNLDEKYLSKIDPDTANELITFLKGLEVTDVEEKDKINITPKRLSFQHEGELGWGDTQYYIDSEGYAHLKGLLLEEYLEVPELKYNRIEINVGDSWRAPGGGVILDVVESSSTSGTVTLKLDDGELGAVSEDDLCMGIYHFMGDGESNNAIEDKDDFETGEREIKGFATSYFQILTVSEDHTSFTYRLRPGYTVHPQPTMSFVGFGNITNKNRQTSSYQTRTYQRYMINRDDWSYTMANISAQFGDLTTLGGDYDEYSAYLNNVYFTGKIEQLIADKIEVRLAKEKISVEKDDLDQYILGPQITNNVLSVMEGDRLLTPTNNTVEGDLEAGEYFINIEGVGITPGAISINTVDRNIAIGDSSNMTTDIARILYTIKLKRANGKNESIAKYQEISFLKGIQGVPGVPGEPGEPGEDGSGIASVVLKHAFSTNGDSKPYEDGSTNWISGIPTNTSSQKGKYLWVQTITTYTKGIPTTYSYTVSYIPQDGEDGKDGKDGTDGTPGTDGADSVSVTASKEGHTYTFYSTSSPTPKGAWSDGKSTLSVYKGTQKLTYTTGTLGNTNYTVTVTPTPNAGTNGIKIGSESSNFFVYPEKLPTDTINIILTVKVKVKGITEEFTKVLTYSRLNDGVAGVGVPIVYRGTWDVAKTYYGNDKRMDIVKYDGHYWKAKNVTGSSTEGFEGIATRPGDSSSHWDSFGAEFESVATELFLAEKANIASFAFENQTMYSQSGYIVDSLGNYTGVTTSDGRLDNPLFKSNLYLNGETGELQARTGYIGGFTIHKDMLQSTHGTTPSISLNGITGKLIANDATIKGHIEAVTGDIGGFNIEEEKLITTGAGLSGVAGVSNDNPAFWAGGTYAQAIANTAKTILRHDGSGQLAGGNIEWDVAGNVELSGKIASGGGISTIDNKIRLNSNGSGSLASGNLWWTEEGDLTIWGKILTGLTGNKRLEINPDNHSIKMYTDTGNVVLEIGGSLLGGASSNAYIRIYDYSYNVLSKTLEISPTQIRIYQPSGRSITLSQNKIEIRNDDGSTSFSATMTIKDGVNEKLYLRARGLPTSSSGLLTGEMYRDSSGYIKSV